MPDSDTASSSKERAYWMSENPEKLQAGTRERLEQWTQTHRDLNGFVLTRCDLSGINLARRQDQVQGYDLRNCDLYRANLSNAHLFSVDFSSASLMKANLKGANLHCANLENTNLLGAQLDEAKLDNVKWGKTINQERRAKEAERLGDIEQALDLYQQAEEIYRNLRINLEKTGLFANAGCFFHREMVMRRMQMKKRSFPRAVSRLVDLFSGYGEMPLRVVCFSMAFIFLCASIYFLSSGIMYQGIEIGLNFNNSFYENITQFMSCLYFSVVTFTTLGYGDVTPLGGIRSIAALEAFAGSFTMALFVVVFVKKMTR